MSVDWSAVSDHVARTSGNDRLLLHESCLQWTPPVHSDDDDDEDDTADGQVADVDPMSCFFMLE